MNSSENKLGNCEVCAVNEAKYTCPKCEVKTCALMCVNIHKKELKCDGIRDKTKFVPLSNFSNLDLLSDYRLLEDANRTVDNLKNDKTKKFTRFRKELPRHLFLLKKELECRKTTIQILPANFTRHKENTTHLDFKSKIVYWRIEWVFVQADNLKLVEEKCDENYKLSHLIDDYLDPIKCTNDQLKYYQAVGLNGISFYIKAENKPGTKYYRLESYLNLKENLRNKTIVEYPTIYVSFTDHFDMFEVIESDEEFATSDIANPSKYVSDLIKAEEKDITAGGKGSLMFITEYSDDMLSSDEN